MKQLYKLLEDVQGTIAERFIPGYSLGSIYKALTYTLIYAALLRRKLGRYELLRPLERRVPPPLLVAVKKELTDKLYHLLEQVDSLLASYKPVLDREADLRRTIDAVKREVGGVDYVLVYDCMSLIEQLAISAFLKVEGVKPVFLSTVFVNPVGVTRFVTHQLYGTGYRVSLRGVAKYIADELGAPLYMKSSFIDEIVHEVGILGVEEFLDKMDINRVAREVLEKARSRRVLVLSDHGYDVVVSARENYIYIIHGFSLRDSPDYTPLVLLSRLTLFMGVHGDI